MTIPNGLLRLGPHESITPIEYDWKELYYQAMIAIAASDEGRNPKPLKEQMAVYVQRNMMQFIITGPVSDEGLP